MVAAVSAGESLSAGPSGGAECRRLGHGPPWGNDGARGWGGFAGGWTKAMVVEEGLTAEKGTRWLGASG
jgi:hypothetical protein